MLSITITAKSVKDFREQLAEIFEQLPLPGFDSVGSAPTKNTDTNNPGAEGADMACGRRAVVTPGGNHA